MRNDPKDDESLLGQRDPVPGTGSQAMLLRLSSSRQLIKAQTSSAVRDEVLF